MILSHSVQLYDDDDDDDACLCSALLSLCLCDSLIDDSNQMSPVGRIMKSHNGQRHTTRRTGVKRKTKKDRVCVCVGGVLQETPAELINLTIIFAERPARTVQGMDNNAEQLMC